MHFSPDHRAIKSGGGATGGWIPPVPDNLIVGKLKQWAEHASVTSIRIPGYWILKEGTDIDPISSPQPGEKVVLALHGGAYIRLSAHPSDPPGVIARGLVRHVESIHRVFAVEYRLSSGEPFKVAHPFPTALIDALAGYIYLVNEIGFSPSDIIVEGDSAGGNLAYALTRYLTEYKGTPGLPAPPGALILLSPWADVSDSHNHIPGGSATTCVESDILGDPITNLKYPMKSFLGPHGVEAADTNPYISPASLHPSMEIDFKGFPRTFLVAGGAEVVLDQIRTLRDRLVKDLGEGNGILEGEGKVRYYEPPDAIHDFLVFPWHEPESRETFQVISEWISPVQLLS